MVAKVEDMIFTRGVDGILIAQEVELEALIDRPKVKIIPLTRGQLSEVSILAKSEDINEQLKADLTAIKYGLKEPQLTEQQIQDLKPSWSTAIAIAIMAISSDKEQSELLQSAKIQDKMLEVVEDKLKKKTE